MIKLSIIIPYYETYDYTIKLLKELRIQKTEEVEIILIDDGCNEIMFDEFKEFTIIHLDKNYGASYAWNIGIKKAQGKFIGFIDSDDMIMMNYIDTLINAIDKDYADEMVFGFIDISKNLLLIKPKCRAIWKGIYRKEIVPYFDENVFYNTDKPFRKQLDETPHTIYYLNKVLYCYRSLRENSITWKKHEMLGIKHKIGDIL